MEREITAAEDTIVPLRAGQPIGWQQSNG